MKRRISTAGEAASRKHRRTSKAGTTAKDILNAATEAIRTLAIQAATTINDGENKHLTFNVVINLNIMS